jgi:uncharacterized membrane protein YgcG
MFTKLTDTNKAAIFSVLVLCMSVGAALLIKMLGLSGYGLAAVWSFTPTVAALIMLLVVTREGYSREGWKLLEDLHGQHLACRHSPLGAQLRMGPPQFVNRNLLPGVGEPLPCGRLRDTDRGGYRDRRHMGGPLPQKRYEQSTEGQRGSRSRSSAPRSHGGLQVGTQGASPT